MWTATACAAYALAIAACGSASAGGATGTAGASARAATALKFSQCMRSHGVPNLPDPTFSGGGARLSISPGSGIDPRSPAFQQASRKCGGPPGPGGKPGSGGKGNAFSMQIRSAAPAADNSGAANNSAGGQAGG